MVQATAKLEEKAVIVVGREEDAALVKEAAEAAKSKYKQTFKKDAPQVTVSTEEYLPAGSGKGNEGSSWCDLQPSCMHIRLFVRLIKFANHTR